MNTPRENSRDKILDAAFRLLSKKGYANVSMRDIAAEAQVALGLLTYHFRTKENLLRHSPQSLFRSALTM